MKHYRIRYRSLFVLLVLITSLLLPACGELEDWEEPGMEETAAAELAEQAPAEEAPAEEEDAGEEEQIEEEETAESEETGESEAALPESVEGELVTDLGFRPETDGFSFENYGNESGTKNLTAAEVQRLFGDDACSRFKNGACVLTPAGKQWMEEINAYMADGHCEGFAALSLLMYTGQVDPAAFNGEEASDLSLKNEKLQREIAYWWATQTLSPTVDSMIKDTPQGILQRLMDMSPDGESYTVGIYQSDGSGGHAITPYAVQDEGGGIYSILVYDNNYPNEQRKITVDTNEDTWSYEASINPEVESELYEGDAESQTLDLTPTSARLSQQDCPFCADGEYSGKIRGLAAPERTYNQIFLDGDGRLLIEDEQGNQLGMVDGKRVNQIPGARTIDIKTGAPSEDDPEPIYLIPHGMDVTVTLDGSTLAEESVTDLVMIGPGFTIGVEGILLDPSQTDTIGFFPNDETIVYDTDSEESPTFVVGIEQPGGADYDFAIQGTAMQGGGMITVVLDTQKGDVFVNTEKLTNEGKFAFEMTRYTEEEEETFYAEDIALRAGAIIAINYAEWTGNGGAVTFEVDTNGDGEIDEEYVAEDE